MYYFLDIFRLKNDNNNKKMRNLAKNILLGFATFDLVFLSVDSISLVYSFLNFQKIIALNAKITSIVSFKVSVISEQKWFPVISYLKN